MLNFIPISLDCFNAVYNGKTIQIRQNREKLWHIFVEGKRANKGPFVAKRYAVQCIEETIKKIEGIPPPDPDFMTEVSDILAKRSVVVVKPKQALASPIHRRNGNHLSSRQRPVGNN